MQDNANLLLAMVLSMAILMFFETQRLSQLPPSEPEAPLAANDDAPPIPQSAQRVIAQQEAQQKERQKAREAPRLPLRNEALRGSLSLRGAYWDDAVLQQYQESLANDSPHVRLLVPHERADAFSLRYGWLSDGSVTTPDKDSMWLTDTNELTPDNPVTLRFDNGDGIIFEQQWRMDDLYMLTVTQTVINNREQAVVLYPYGLMSRSGVSQGEQFYILHEGGIAFLDEQLVEVSYSDWQDSQQYDSTDGWLGITDKYWLAAFIPQQGDAIRGRFVQQNDKYQADFIAQRVIVPPEGRAHYQSQLFVGAKNFDELKYYENNNDIPQFELAIDFGWFYFLTQPLLRLLLWLNEGLGNMGLAIIVMTVLFRILMYPLADKSFRAINAMRQLHPQLLKLKERYGDDKMKLNQEMMALYKKHQVNPAAGCLPILLQAPIFFALYKVLFVSIEMRQAPFWGWISDLSAPDPTNLFTLFGLLSWELPSWLHVGIWPLVMGGTMVLHQRMSPTPMDAIQAKVFAFLPFIFTVILAAFPAGLVIYWTWNNILSMLQQYMLLKRHPLDGARREGR